ncbi:MAG TPA: serine/threonine-protein kinase [Gemmataceae bacterium]|nr:serine/threonine-protein kinase [Gemmataceae bacterium]
MLSAQRCADADFVKGLRAYGLLRDEDLPKVHAYRQAFPQRGNKELTEFLVGQKALTRYQADTLMQGNPAELVLSQFVLTDVLGNGSMGTVYKARSTKSEGSYALKVVPRRNVVTLNTVAEKVKALAEIRHPRVSALVHLGAAGERVYLAWPFLEGGEKLDAWVARQGKLSARQAIGVALQIASGLQPYHEAGLFHGLLKPSDVVIGTDKRVRILDFGVGFLLTSERGKSLLDTMTNTRALARGVDCASPESLANPLDRAPAGDQYSLGCVLYFCLTGQYPFPEKNPVKKMLAHQFEEPQPLRELSPEVSPRVAAVVQRLMRKDPAERYESTAEAVKALQVASTSRPAPLPAETRRAAAGSTRPVTPSAQPADEAGRTAGGKGSRAATWIGVGAAAGVLAGAALGWLVMRLL